MKFFNCLHTSAECERNGCSFQTLIPKANCCEYNPVICCEFYKMDIIITQNLMSDKFQPIKDIIFRSRSKQD